MMSLPRDPELLRQIVDVHCHPTDSDVSDDRLGECPITICAMSTRPDDQSLVRDLAIRHPSKVIPCFGYHPWFSHWIAVTPFQSKEEHYRRLFLESATRLPPNAEEDFSTLLGCLPDPYPLESLLSRLRQDLLEFPGAMLGEVGLDRSMRVPFGSTPGQRRLSSLKTPIEHQLCVLEAQVAVAVELQRSISLHSVNCHAITSRFLDRMRKQYGIKWDSISVDLHSCGLSAESWVDIERHHSNVYCSLSTVINLRSPAHRSLIAACSSERLLAESDFHDISESASRTWEIMKIIADIKGWRVEDSSAQLSEKGGECEGVVRRLAENWRAFVSGQHIVPSGQRRKALLVDSEFSTSEG